MKQNGQDIKSWNKTQQTIRQPQPIPHPDIIYATRGDSSVAQKGSDKRLEHVINDLQIGKHIQMELKSQGRSVTWLALQLGMERTSLYYTFRQNSIDVELLLRISAFMEHNFLQDVADMYNAYK